MTEYDIPKYGDKKNCAIKKSFSMGKMFTEAQKYGLGRFVSERKFDGFRVQEGISSDHRRLFSVQWPWMNGIITNND